jgi:hypothetical protein
LSEPVSDGRFVEDISERLRACAREGTLLDFEALRDADLDDPDSTPSAELRVPADLLLDLLTSDTDVHPRGVQIRGARIVGDLSWEWRHLSVPLKLTDCILDEALVLTHARIARLDLDGCCVPALLAAEMTSLSTLRLVNCVFSGVVQLVDATRLRPQPVPASHRRLPAQRTTRRGHHGGDGSAR